jgi:hypothetical protein
MTPTRLRRRVPLPGGRVLTDKATAVCGATVVLRRPTLGSVRVGIEGGFAAVSRQWRPHSPSQQPSGKRPPCHTDQQCNQDESVSALWGKCTPLGVCECNPLS